MHDCALNILFFAFLVVFLPFQECEHYVDNFFIPQPTKFYHSDCTLQIT